MSSGKIDEPRINFQIKVDKVRLIDAAGEMVGVVSVEEGVRLARASGLDLVEVSPNAEPPVCKILDYGKYKYEAQKKASEARKKQKIVVLKEIKLRPTIDPHDLSIKLKQSRKFLEEGDKVKFTLRFRGREMSHQQLGLEVMTKVKAELQDLSKVESDARIDGRQAVMILGPSKVH
jgi:translation initiation factor IF-3